MIKQDLLGEYNTDSIPAGFELPVAVNERNNDIHFLNGTVIWLKIKKTVCFSPARNYR